MTHQVKQPAISVIIPVYNVEKYVERAVKSILSQSFQDFEILIVDDGSQDRSGAVCDKLADQDVRITVFHTKNQGAHAARNYALDRARGTYIMFSDADDWLAPNMLKDMYEMSVQHNLELAICGFFIDTYYGEGDEHLSEIKNVPSRIFASQQEFREHAHELFDKNQLYTPWNKLFLRERIETLSIRYKDTFWDDFPFVLDVIRDIERVGVTEIPYYHFIRARAESETARWRPDMYAKREEEHGWMLNLYEYWDLANYAPAQEVIQRRYIERVIGCIENVCNASCTLSAQEKRERIREMICSENAQRAVAIAQPQSAMMKQMLAPIKSKNVHLAYLEGRLISYVKAHNTRMFATLKSKR